MEGRERTDFMRGTGKKAEEEERKRKERQDRETETEKQKDNRMRKQRIRRRAARAVFYLGHERQSAAENEDVGMFVCFFSRGGKAKVGTIDKLPRWIDKAAWSDVRAGVCLARQEAKKE